MLSLLDLEILQNKNTPVFYSSQYVTSMGVRVPVVL